MSKIKDMYKQLEYQQNLLLKTKLQTAIEALESGREIEEEEKEDYMFSYEEIAKVVELMEQQGLKENKDFDYYGRSNNSVFDADPRFTPLERTLKLNIEGHAVSISADSWGEKGVPKFITRESILEGIDENFKKRLEEYETTVEEYTESTLDSYRKLQILRLDDLKIEEPKKIEEEMDGLKIVHTGLKDETDMEIIDIYDENGNRWYTNCPSIEGAQKIVERLKADGKEAVIGPKAPGRKKDGTLVRNPMEGTVGVYIVKTIEEKEDSKPWWEPDPLTIDSGIEFLDLSIRSYNKLKKAGIHKVGEFLDKSEEELSKIKGLGPKVIEEIRQKKEETLKEPSVLESLKARKMELAEKSKVLEEKTREAKELLGSYEKLSGAKDNTDPDFKDE